MNPIIYILMSLYFAIAFASAETEAAKGQGEAPDPAQIHLRVEGTFVLSSKDYLINADDTYSLQSTVPGSKEAGKSEGKSKGFFREVIGLVDKYHMWEVTADSLKEDLKRAQGGGLFGVTDASHYYLTITTKGRTLKADFYAPDSFSSHYPEAKQLAAFDFVTKFIIQKTEEREQAGAGQPATRSESKPDGNQNPKPEADGRSR